MSRDENERHLRIYAHTFEAHTCRAPTRVEAMAQARLMPAQDTAGLSRPEGKRVPHGRLIGAGRTSSQLA